jgi:hypothetical protein
MPKIHIKNEIFIFYLKLYRLCYICLELFVMHLIVFFLNESEYYNGEIIKFSKNEFINYEKIK